MQALQLCHRLVLACVGALVACVGATMLGAVSLEYVPLPWTPPTVAQDDAGPGTRDPLSTSVTVSVAEESGASRLDVLLTVVYPDDSAYLAHLAEGGSGCCAGLEVADVVAENGNRNLYVQFDPPVVERDGDLTGRALYRGHTERLDLGQPLVVTVDRSPLASPCEGPCPSTTVRVELPGWQVGAVEPSEQVSRQDADLVMAAVDADQPQVQVQAAPVDPSPVTMGPSLPGSLDSLLRSLARTGWPLLAYVLLGVRLAGWLDARGAAVPEDRLVPLRRVGGALATLLLLGAVGVVLTVADALSYQPLWPLDLARLLGVGGLGDADGSLVAAAIVGVVATVALAAPWPRRAGSPEPGRRPVRRVAGLLLGLGLLVLVVGSVVALLRRGTGYEVFPLDGGPSESAVSGGVVAAVVLGGVGVAVGCLLVALATSPSWRRALLAGVVGLSFTVLGVALLGSFDWLPSTGGTALAGLTGVALVAVPTSLAVLSVGRLRRRTRVLAVVGLLLLGVLAMVPDLVGGYGLWLTGPLLWSARGLLHLSLLLVVVVLVAELDHVDTLPRGVVLALGYVLLLRPDVQYAYLPWSFLVGLVLVGAVLVPRRGYPAAPLRPPPDAATGEQTQQHLGALALAHAGRQMEDALVGKVAGAQITEAEAARLREVVGTTRFPDSGERRRHTSWPGSMGPWRRATYGALAGGVVGLVLQLAYVTENVAQVRSVVGFEAWTAVVALVLAFQFPLYGFFFGFAFPLLPGAHGLARATRLFLVLAVLEALVLLVPLDPSADLVRALALRLLQLAVLCAVLGVGADLLTLRRAGLDSTRLRVLYGTSRFVLWSSGLVVAIATTTATAMLGSAATLLLDEIQPVAPVRSEQVQQP